MRGVLGWMTADDARRILNFANSGEISVQQKAVSVAAKTRKDQRNNLEQEVHFTQWIMKKLVCRRILFRQYASSPIRKKSGYEW